MGEPSGGRTERVERFSSLLTAAGFEAPVLDRIRDEIWLKLWGNLTFNPVSALTRSTLVDICRDERTRALAAFAKGLSLTVMGLWVFGATAYHVLVLGLPFAHALSNDFVPSVQEYAHYYGLDQKKLAYAKPDALVMHPGPMNRGVEIDSIVADGAQSLIREQVEMGVAVRMAVLEALALAEEACAMPPPAWPCKVLPSHRPWLVRRSTVPALL